jgi:hypothetical protein
LPSKPTNYNAYEQTFFISCQRDILPFKVDTFSKKKNNIILMTKLLIL